MDEVPLSLLMHGANVSGSIMKGGTIILGQRRGALETNGVNETVHFGNHQSECFQSPDMCHTGVTFALWIQRMRNVGFVEEVFLDTGGYYLRSIGYVMYQDASGHFYIAVYDQWFYYGTKVPGWSINQWDYIVWSWDTINGIRIYINGCRLSADSFGSWKGSRPYAVGSYEPFTVGSSSKGEYNARMKLDDLLIWHRVLDDGQVWQLYVNGGRW